MLPKRVVSGNLPNKTLEKPRMEVMPPAEDMVGIKRFNSKENKIGRETRKFTPSEKRTKKLEAVKRRQMFKTTCPEDFVRIKKKLSRRKKRAKNAPRNPESSAGL